MTSCEDLWDLYEKSKEIADGLQDDLDEAFEEFCELENDLPVVPLTGSVLDEMLAAWEYSIDHGQALGAATTAFFAVDDLLNSAREIENAAFCEWMKHCFEF